MELLSKYELQRFQKEKYQFGKKNMFASLLDKKSDYNDWLEEIFRIRYDVFLKMGVISSDKYPKNMVEDEYDRLDTTYHLVIVRNNHVVGSARILGDYQNGFSVEESFSIDFYLDKIDYDINDISEISRLVVLPKYRKENIGTYILYNLPKFSFDILGKKAVVLVGNPNYSGLMKIGCKKLGQSKKYKIDGDKENVSEHKAVPLYLDENLLRPIIGLENHWRTCFIINPLEG